MRSVKYRYISRVGTTNAPPINDSLRIPKAILLSERWLDEIFPVSHSRQKSRLPTIKVASIGPGRFRVAISTRVSSCQPKDFNFCMHACLIGLTPLPFPRFLPGSSKSVKDPESGGHSMDLMDWRMCPSIFFQSVDREKFPMSIIFSIRMIFMAYSRTFFAFLERELASTSTFFIKPDRSIFNIFAKLNIVCKEGLFFPRSRRLI
jgi:hypothetical protein